MINTQNLIEMLIIAAITIISITVHEFSHGYMSYLLGDDTPKVYRRLTLNPLKHLDVIGAVCLAVFHFGWAKPVPINPNNYKNKKLGVVAVSLAGPISNIILAFIATVLYVFVPDKNNDYTLYYHSCKHPKTRSLLQPWKLLSKHITITYF